MSRNTAPRLRKVRALGSALPGLTRKSAEKRPYGPGQHGPTRRRQKASAYSLALREKQKVRFNYGLTEGAFRRLVERATRMRGNTGVTLIQLLERRLDNVVFRAGFARTIPAARQLVSHGHVAVNGRTCDIPSRQLDLADVVSVRESGRAMAERAHESGSGLESPWLEVDRPAATVRVAGFPDETFLPFEVEPRLIVEYYSRVL